MVKKELVDYIKKEVAAGYNVSYLRSYLVKQGYSSKDVDEAIDSLQGKHKTIHIPTNLLIVTIAAIVIIILGIFAVVRLVGNDDGAVDRTPSPTQTTPQQSQQTTTTLPSQTQPTTPTSQTQEEPEVEVRYTSPTQTSVAVVLDKIPKISESEAVSLCNKYSGTDKDNCFMRIALEKGNSDMCAEIVNPRKRDDCYMSLAYLDDYSVCIKIEDVYLKQSCRELGNLQLN